MRFISIYRRLILSAFTLIAAAFLSVSICFAQAETETPDPVTVFNRGQDAHEKGDLQTALKFYDEAIKLAPEFPEAEYQRGNALFSLGKTDEAEKAFRRALELRENWTLPMTSLGVLLVGKNNFAEAEKFLTKAVESDEQNFPAYSALTELRLKSNADAKTLNTLLTKLRVLTSTARASASIWISRAALEDALGDKIAAKMSLNRALTIEPTNKAALMQIAEIALAEGDTSAAAGIVESISKFAPNSIEVNLLQAKILIVEGKTDEALKTLNAVINPTSEVLFLRDKIAAVRSVNAAELEKQLEKDGKNTVILGRLCTLLRKDEPAKALDYCRRASEIEPRNINHAVGFGAALVQVKRYEDAVLLLRKLLQIAPDNFTARANLATALFQLKRYEEAVTEYQQMTKMQPNLAITYFFLAISYDNLGQYMDAMANYQQFLKLADPVQNKLEIEKVELRLPGLQKQMKSKK